MKQKRQRVLDAAPVRECATQTDLSPRLAEAEAAIQNWLALHGGQATPILRAIPARLRQSRSAIDSAEDRFRALCACSSLAIFITDAEGRSIYTNARFNAVTGAESESLGYGWAEIIHP